MGGYVCLQEPNCQKSHDSANLWTEGLGVDPSLKMNIQSLEAEGMKVLTSHPRSAEHPIIPEKRE